MGFGPAMRDLYQVALKALGSPREFGEGFRTPGEPWVEPWGSPGELWDSPGQPWGSPGEVWGSLRSPGGLWGISRLAVN